MSQQLSFSEQFSHSTVRIECETKDGGFSVGTGFFFTFVTDAGSIPAIATNKHVIAGAALGSFALTLKGSEDVPQLGRYEILTLDNFEQRWTFHPDNAVDLCMMPMAPVFHEAESEGIAFYYRSFGKKDLPSTELLSRLTALEDIIMVGYPVGIWDSINNMPVFRSGITATHPKLDHNGKKEFLVDCACFPGSSGSPVLLYYPTGGFRDAGGNYIIGDTRVKLLGVLWGGPQFTVTGDIKAVPIPTQLQPVSVSKIPINLGFVIRAERLLDFEPLLTKQV